MSAIKPFVLAAMLLSTLAGFSQPADPSDLTRRDIEKLLYRIDADLLMADTLPVDEVNAKLRRVRDHLYQVWETLGDEDIPSHHLSRNQLAEYSDGLALYEGLLQNLYFRTLADRGPKPPAEENP